MFLQTMTKLLAQEEQSLHNMRGLADSNEDVIFLVLEAIRALTSKEQFLKDLRSLSLTSHYLRSVCLPLIFRIFRRTWDMSVGKRREILPPTLCQYVTCVKSLCLLSF